MRTALLGSLCFLFSSCATLSKQTDALFEKGHSLPEKVQVLNVPFIQQKENYCGPASLAMVLKYAGKNLEQDELAKYTFTPSKAGSLQTDMISAARRQGMMTLIIRDIASLLKEISDGRPVIVLQNLGFSFYPAWHYAVALAYDLKGPDIYLHSGDKRNKISDLRIFERSWTLAGTWGLLIIKPGELAITSSEFEHATAAAALEQLGMLSEAEIAYRSILLRWPESFGALIGLGNTYYANKNFKRSVNILELAVKIHPDSTIAEKNLTTARKALSASP